MTRKEKGMATNCRPADLNFFFVASDPKREGYGNSLQKTPWRVGSELQVTRKEKGMATLVIWPDRTKILVASDPKREGYGNY